MEQEFKIAYLNSQILCARAELEGMLAANAQSIARGGYPVYGETDFTSIPARYGIDHNSIMEYWRS